MPDLPAKDELVSLDRLSSWALWKWYNSKGFGPAWTGDYMAWGSISLFGGSLENENSLETMIVIFENVSPEGSLWLKMKYFEISVLTANFRYLQTAALKPLSRLPGVCFFSKVNSRQENRSKLSFTARIIAKYSLERFLSICGEKMSKGFLKFYKLIIKPATRSDHCLKSYKRA